MAKFKGGYYTRKGDYIWVWVQMQPGEDTGYYKSGWLDYVGSLTKTSTADLKESDWAGRKGWERVKGATGGMSGAEFSRAGWRHVPAKNVPLVWRKFLNLYK